MNQAAPIIEQKKAIASLFSKAKISKVAYIDDRFDTEKFKGDFIGSLIELYETKKNIEYIEFVNWELPKPVFEKRIADIWKMADNTERNEFLEKIYKVTGANDEVVNISGVIHLPEYLNDFIIQYSPTKWEEKKEDFFASNVNEGHRVLCVFDKELENGKDGIKLLEDVLTGDYRENAYCAIFSQHVSIGYEFDQKKKWVEEKDLSEEIANKFYPISKETFQFEPWGFIEGLKNVLVVEEVEKLKRHSKEIVLNAQKKVVTDLENLTPESYNQIIQRSSIIEGVWEMNTLFRIANILQDIALKTSVTSSEDRVKFNSSVLLIRDFDRIQIADNPVRWNKQTKDLRDKEIFESGEIINSLHYPLANGDVFEIGEKKYILLGQPCNLSIRKNGKRDYDYDTGTLVQLMNEEKEYCEKIPLLKLWARFPVINLIKLDILDLSVFDENGICRLIRDRELLEPSLFHLSMINRYKIIKRKFNIIGEKVELFESILTKAGRKGQFNEILNSIIAQNTSLKDLPEILYDKGSKEFNFEMKRILRLKEPYSADLLQKYMLYLSRNAFEHDFTITI